MTPIALPAPEKTGTHNLAINGPSDASRALAPLSPAAPASREPASGWASVRYYADAAGKFAHAQLACQVMAGFALIDLHKATRTKPGAAPGNQHAKKQLPNDSVIVSVANDAKALAQNENPVLPVSRASRAISWPSLVKQEAGISDDTARNWMAMAKACRPRLKKLDGFARLRALLELPPHQWSADDTKLITAAVRKITDGYTQLEFMEDLGLSKKPQGSGARGNKNGRPPGKPGLDEQIVASRDQALSDWNRASKTLEAAYDNFTLLDDPEITLQIAILEAHLKARKLWLNTPKLSRTPQVLAHVVNALKS